jgi:hypothetical protein
MLSMLSIEGRIYYLICDYTWTVLSLFNYLMEHTNASEILQPSTRWADAHADLANWISTERFLPIDIENVPKVDADYIYSLTDATTDRLILHWHNNLWFVARNLHQRHQNVSEVMWLYYYYYRLTSKTLAEFANILANDSVSQTIFYERYQQNIEAFQRLTDLLENERIELQNSVGSELKIAALSAIEEYASNFVASWKEAVYSAANSSII